MVKEMNDFVDYVSYLTKNEGSNGKVKRGRVLRSGQVQVTKVAEEIPSDADHDRPHLTVYRNRGVVESIEIYCVCGRHLKVDLVYADEEDGAAQGR